MPKYDALNLSWGRSKTPKCYVPNYVLRCPFLANRGVKIKIDTEILYNVWLHLCTESKV